MKKTAIIAACIFVMFLATGVHAAANLQVSSFSCSPNEVKVNSQFTCTATIQNTGDASGSLNTATLYPDATSWMENNNYAETVNTNINSGASAQVVFNGLKGKKTGDNGFARIMIDNVADTYVADNGVRVNVINVVVTSSATATSGVSGASVDLTAQATVGGNVDTILSISLSGTGCTISTQPSSASINNMNDGQTTSHTWTMTIGSTNCSYTLSAQATSNPSGTTSKTDSTSGTITCSNCGGTSSSSSSGGGGGGGGGSAAGNSQTISKSSITKGTTGEFKFSLENLSITQVDVLAGENMTQTILKISYFTTTPSTTTELSNTYKYLEFNATNLSKADKITIKFKVNKTWVLENSIDSDKVYLYRFANYMWNKLSTTKSNNDSSYYYYEAQTPGFSYFAIAGDKLSSQAQQTSTKTTESDQPPSEQKITTPSQQPEKKEIAIGPISVKPEELGIGAIIAILIVVGILGWYYYHGHKRIFKD